MKVKLNGKKSLALILAATLSLGILSGCGGGGSTETTDPNASGAVSTESGAQKDSATLATSGEPTRFFPHGSEGSNNNDYLVLNNIYDTLVFLDADGTLQPSLAKEWTISEDGLCYTFKLQEGVKFHDGSTMTA